MQCTYNYYSLMCTCVMNVFLVTLILDFCKQKYSLLALFIIIYIHVICNNYNYNFV